MSSFLGGRGALHTPGLCGKMQQLENSVYLNVHLSVFGPKGLLRVLKTGMNNAITTQLFLYQLSWYSVCV